MIDMVSRSNNEYKIILARTVAESKGVLLAIGSTIKVKMIHTTFFSSCNHFTKNL